MKPRIYGDFHGFFNKKIQCVEIRVIRGQCSYQTLQAFLLTMGAFALQW
jgi:hypothetical protein